MIQRIIVGIVGVPIVVCAILLGTPWITILVSLACIPALNECSKLTASAGEKSSRAFSFLWTAAFIINGHLFVEQFHILTPILLSLCVLSSIPWVLFQYGVERPFRNAFFMLIGPLYIGFLLSHAIMLSNVSSSLSNTNVWLLYVVLTTFGTDTAAFFSGTLYGKHFMCPKISPKKTWEGAGTGLIFAIGSSLILSRIFVLPIDLWLQFVYGMLIGFVAITGDMIESYFKRYANVKNSGTIVPGHGGILDRLDSLLFTIPIMYYIITITTSS